MAYVSLSGSTGADHSYNPASVPIAGYVLLATIPARNHNHVAVQNHSADQVQVVRDDGAGNNQTTVLLVFGGGAGKPGGSWDSYTSKGRLRIHAPNATDQVAAYDE